LKEPTISDQVFIRKLTEIIHANLGNENFGVEEFAHESGMSLYRLGRKLHSINKKTVNQFIREIRLQKALEMLQHEPYTAAEVAYRTGFGSPAYFNKCFHEFFGYPPGKVIKGEVKNDKPNDLTHDTDDKELGKTNKKANIFSLPGILVSVLILVSAVFLIYIRIQKSGSPGNLTSKDTRITIAVMPFLNMTRDTTWDVWQDGIQQDLISYFSNCKELKVRQKEITKTLLQIEGVSAYASISPDIASTISRKLDAGIFIYGNIQKAGPRIRLNAQLIGTRTKEVLQSFEVNGPYKDDIIIDITDSLSKKITDYLLISRLLKEFPTYQHLPGLTTNSPEAFRYFLYGNNAIDDKTAVDWYLKALMVDSNFFYPMMGLSTSYSNMGMPEQNLYWVLKYYGKREQWPVPVQIAAKWAYAFHFESAEEQIKYLRQGEQIDDQNPNNYHVLGYTYLTLKQYDKAIPVLEKSLTIAKRWGKDYLKSQVYWFYGYLGSAYHRTSQYMKEKKLYKDAEKYDPDDRWVISNHAVLSFAEKDTAEANRYIHKYISVNKEKFSSSEAHIAAGVGDIYNMAGMLDIAEGYYRKSFSLEPENPGRMSYLAEFFIYANRNLNEVPDLMDKAMKLAHTKTDYYNYLNTKGWSLYKQGKYKEALEVLEKTWNEAPFKLYSIKSHLEEVRKAVALNK
jgi:TolB-like protein/AraC-like DNA-binding protein/cytochrome c-type biogenesis protein CcmH/NrfG